MNKWDVIGYAGIFFGFGINFTLPSNQLIFVVGNLFFAIGAYLLWYKGNVFKNRFKQGKGDYS